MSGETRSVGQGLREVLHSLAEGPGAAEPCARVETVLARLQGLLGLQHAAVCLFADDFGALHPVLAWPRPAEARPVFHGPGLAWFVHRANRDGLFHLAGPDGLPDHAAGERAWLEHEGLSNAILVALHHDGSLAGLLVLASPPGPRPPWTDEARPLLLRLAVRLGRFTPRLLPAPQHLGPAAMLCRLSAAAEALGVCADQDAVFRVTVEQAVRSLGLPAIGLHARDGDRFVGACRAAAGTKGARPLEGPLPKHIDLPAAWLEALAAGGARWKLIERDEAATTGPAWTAVTAVMSEGRPGPRALLVNASPAPGVPVNGTQQEMLVRLAALAARALERCEGQQHRGSAEAASRRNERLESMVGMAGVLAHDLNNLLMPVIGYSKLIADNVGEEGQLRTEATEILRAAEEVSGLASRLLAVGRRRMRQLGVSDLARLVAERRGALNEALGEGIQLHVETVEDLPLVQTDPDTLFDMLRNLLVNAHEALPEGGEVHIRAASCELGPGFCACHAQVQPGTYVRISVEDNGPGMSPDVANHAFDPFFTTRKRRGAGLGLPTVYGAVRQCGGCVDLHSRPGEGTRVDIILPPAPAVMETSPGPPPGPPPEGTETVLVIDDEERVLRVVTHMLESLGYRVLAAGSGPEALDRVRELEGDLDLVLTDVVMPGMDGLETVNRLRRLREDLCALYMSGYADADLGDPSLDILRKPFTPQQLGRRIRVVLEG